MLWVSQFGSGVLSQQGGGAVLRGQNPGKPGFSPDLCCRSNQSSKLMDNSQRETLLRTPNAPRGVLEGEQAQPSQMCFSNRTQELSTGQRPGAAPVTPWRWNRDGAELEQSEVMQTTRMGFGNNSRMGKGGLEAQRSARAPQVTQDWVLQVPWGHSPQTCSSPASPTDTSRVASAFKCNLKGNKGLIHLRLKTVFSHILLLARPPSWAISARSVTRAQLLEAPSSKRAGDVNILFFISFFFFLPPHHFPFSSPQLPGAPVEHLAKPLLVPFIGR